MYPNEWRWLFKTAVARWRGYGRSTVSQRSRFSCQPFPENIIQNLTQHRVEGASVLPFMRRYSTTSSLSSFLKSSHSCIPLRSFSMATSSLHLNFDNAILRHLPTSDNTPFQGSKTSPGDTPGICYSMIPDVQPVSCPELVLLSSSALALIDFPTTDHQSLPTAEHSTLVSYLCGNVPFPGSRLAAHCYAGHQFGYFSGKSNTRTKCR